MDGSQFDRLTRALGSGLSRRAAVKAALGLGTASLAGSQLASDAGAARRPTPTPKPVVCHTPKVLSGGQCVCPEATTACGPDCCPAGSECCDNACCYGTCSSEEICCPTGDIPCGKKCCGTGTRCVHGGCFDDPCRTIGEPCAVNGDCCGVDAYAVCEFSESQRQDVCTYSSLT